MNNIQDEDSHMKRNFALLTLLALVAVILSAVPASAQMVRVEAQYRVVEVDRNKNRFGIANLDANPTVRQNWVYLRLDTKVVKRYECDGWMRDEDVSVEEACDVLQVGDLVNINGGRGWNGSITAKSILIQPENVVTDP